MITIAWDVDDVLNNLTYEWLKYFCKKYDRTITYNELTVNPPCEIIGVSLDEYLKTLDEFRMTDIALNLTPNKHILEWMKKSGKRFNHIALSATSAQTAQNGAYWVMKNFYEYIHSYNIVPSYRNDDNIFRPFKDKGEFIKNCKYIDILIDDSEKNIERAKNAGAEGFLVKQPWNKDGCEITEILEKLNEF